MRCVIHFLAMAVVVTQAFVAAASEASDAGEAEDIPREVVATMLDGVAISGQLSAWTAEEVLLLVDGEQKSVATQDLLSLRWSKGPEGADTLAAAVELVDGTVLPIEVFARDNDTAKLKLHLALEADAKNVSIPLRTVAAVRLQPLTGDVAEQWDEIREQELVSDVLVVPKRDGQSLDYLEGVVGDVTEAKVEFKFDEESLSVDRARVAGIIYFRRERAGESESDPRCVVHGHEGLRANVSEIALVNGRVRMTTLNGTQLDWPMDDIYLADFSAGKVAFLSDLEPASESWTPLVALPASAKLAARYGRTRRDQSAYGDALSVRFPGEVASGVAPREQTFSKGLALRSRSEIVYRLPDGFRRLLATAGIEPATSSSGDVFLAIDGDGRRLLETQVAGNQPPQDIELDVQGVRRLTIVVDYGENLDTGDWLNLCNARVVK